MNLLTQWIDKQNPIGHVFNNADDAPVTQVFPNRPVNLEKFSVIVDVNLQNGNNGLIACQISNRIDCDEYLFKGWKLFTNGYNLLWYCYEDHGIPHGCMITESFTPGQQLVVATFDISLGGFHSQVFCSGLYRQTDTAGDAPLDMWTATSGTPMVVGFGMYGNGDVSPLCDSIVKEFAVIPNKVITQDEYSKLCWLKDQN